MARSLLYGLGINDAPYAVARSECIDGKWVQTWRCPAYAAWSHVLERSLSEKKKIAQPTYVGVTVCDEWLKFTNFKKWWDVNYRAGYHLDKDILCYGNKIYSPDTCIYVPKWLNGFVSERNSRKGEFPVGVSWSKKYGFFEAGISIKGRKKFLGHFTNKQDAHNRWLKENLTLVEAFKKDLDTIDSRLYPALIYRYTNYKDVV